jgi:TATA-box binding protein (TBP) (component of TFIID and TFIIIB)
LVSEELRIFSQLVSQQQTAQSFGQNQRMPRPKRHADGTLEKHEDDATEIPAAAGPAAAAASPAHHAARAGPKRKAPSADEDEPDPQAIPPPAALNMPPLDAAEAEKLDIENIVREWKDEDDDTDQLSREVLNEIARMHERADPCVELTEEEVAYKNRNVTKPVIHNVVVTCDLNADFSTEKLALQLNGFYDRSRFSAPMQLNLLEPRATALAFGSGKLVVTGAESADAAYYAIHKLRRYIESRTKLKTRVTGVTVCNIMATRYMSYGIDLERVAKVYPQHMFKNKKGFGAKICTGNGTVLVFSSGKVVVCGPKTHESLISILDSITPKLAQFHTHDILPGQIEQEKKRLHELKKAQSIAEQRRRMVEKVNARLKSDEVRLYYHLPNSDVPIVTDVTEIKLGECHAKDPTRYCKHTMQLRFKSDPPGKWHNWGWQTAPEIVRVYEWNKMQADRHFFEPRTSASKRREPRKNPQRLPGTRRLVEGGVVVVSDD